MTVGSSMSSQNHSSDTATSANRPTIFHCRRTSARGRGPVDDLLRRPADQADRQRRVISEPHPFAMTVLPPPAVLHPEDAPDQRGRGHEQHDQGLQHVSELLGGAGRGLHRRAADAQRTEEQAGAAPCRAGVARPSSATVIASKPIVPATPELSESPLAEHVHGGGQAGQRAGAEHRQRVDPPTLMPAVRAASRVGADGPQLEAERAALEQPPHDDAGQRSRRTTPRWTLPSSGNVAESATGGDSALSLPGRWKASLDSR